jgi:hypothetical protein
MELELSITIGNGVLTISVVFREIIGLISKSNNPNMEKKRKKAKSKVTFDLLLTLYK